MEILTPLMAAGIVRGFEMMGARHIKTDAQAFYFEVPQGCEVDDDEKLKRGAEVINRYGMKLRIKRV